MAKLVADHILERLAEWRIQRIYGYPGDGINAFLGAFDRADGNPEFIQVRHEEMAAFMACSHAKFTGEVGVCIATSGPGAIHLLNGLYDAKLDHQPVVAIVGQQAMASLGGSYQQEVDLTNLFKDVAHEYVHMATAPAQARHLVDRAVRIALDQRTVTCIVVPNDVASEKAVEVPPREHGTIHSGTGYSRPKVVPNEGDLDRAATVLNECDKIAILVGQGALHAADQVVEIAETLGAGVAKALLGKGVLPDDLPFVTGSIGLLGTKPSYDLMMGCDALLMVGSSFPYSEFLPKEGKARGVQIDIDGRMVGIRYPMEVNLVGDAKLTLEALLPKLTKKEDRAWRDEIEEGVARLVEADGRARRPGRRSDQPAADLSGAVRAATGRRHPHRRLRLGRELVRAEYQDAQGDDGLPLRDARDDGRRRPVCDCSEVRPSRASGDRARRRRRVPDERDERADHDREIPRALERPAADRARASQQRPEPGDLGAAGHGRRSEVRGLAGSSGLPVRAVRGAARLQGDPRRLARRRRVLPGTRRSRLPDRCSTRRSPIRRCPRCRHTSRCSRRAFT